MLAPAIAAIALGLLAASGVAKMVDPEPTTGAMRTAHLPASNRLSALLGLVEVGVAAVALAAGGIAVIAAAFLYAAFAVFTFMAVRMRIPVQSCGCFGRDDTPPSVIHVVYNVFAALSLIALGLQSSAPIDWDMGVIELVLYLTFTIVGVYASYLLMTRLPRLSIPARSS